MFYFFFERPKLNFLNLIFFASTNIALKLIMLKTPQRVTNIAHPAPQETAKLKNNGRTFSSKHVKKKVNAADGTQKTVIRTIGFAIPNFIFVFLLIIKMFKIAVTDTQLPIPTISALIPITPGKNHMLKNRKTEPIK